MRYLCARLSRYGQVGRALSESEQMAMMDKCFAYDEDVLRKNGHCAWQRAFRARRPPRPCAIRTVKSLSPTAPLQRPKRCWADF